MKRFGAGKVVRSIRRTMRSMRVRSRVAKYLEGKAYRIQYSVFLFEGTEREAQEIRTALLALTEPEEGRALFMAPMCEACCARIWKAGKMREEDEICIVA